MLKWLAIIGATVGTVFAAKKLLATTDRGDIAYTVDRARPFGKYWGDERPPGLPLDVRPASVDEGAAVYVNSIANEQRLGENFTRVMLALADKESSMTFARPANNFGPPSITAWGVFQWNADAWDRLGSTSRDYIDWDLQRSPVAPAGQLRVFPWEQTALQEVEWPIRYYARVWRTAKRRGADDIGAARAVFMWHSGPGRLRRLFDMIDAYGWHDGWYGMGQDLSADTAAWYREKIDSVDRRIAAAGVTP